jgi:DnaJ-domain-containing protein 1
LDLEDHAQTAEDVRNMREEMQQLRERNEILEYRMKKLHKEEQSLSKKVDLDDKLALKKLVVMLKMKNDELKRNGRSTG